MGKSKILKVLFKHKKQCTSCTVITFVSIAAFSFLYQLGFSESIQGTSNAEILQSISVTEDAEMNFGRIFPNGNSGTASIPKTSDTITCVSGGTCTGTVTRGQFSISGSANIDVSISYVDGVLSDGSGNTMALDIESATVDNDTTKTLDASGDATVYIGGILSITSSQIAGSYSTSNSGGTPYTVNVNY
jgi:hypothetical protein